MALMRPICPIQRASWHLSRKLERKITVFELTLETADVVTIRGGAGADLGCCEHAHSDLS